MRVEDLRRVTAKTISLRDIPDRRIKKIILYLGDADDKTNNVQTVALHLIEQSFELQRNFPDATIYVSQLSMPSLACGRIAQNLTLEFNSRLEDAIKKTTHP